MEVYACLAQLFTLICEGSQDWEFSMNTELLLQKFSELFMNQPNGKSIV
jgi:hypothetical protein